MKTIVCPKSGTPDVLKLVDVDKPTHNDNEILVKFIASSVTRGDVNLRKMPKIFLHLIGILLGFKPMQITGIEFSGQVEAIGKKVMSAKGHFLTVRLPTKERPEHFDFLKELAEKGVLRPVIDKTFTLEKVPEAHRYVETGRKKGNVSVQVET